MRLFNVIEFVLACLLLSAWSGAANAQPAPARGAIGNSTKKTQTTLR